MESAGIKQCGDVLGFQFSGEQQLVLFAPQAGDVMVCSLTDWQGLLTEAHSRLHPALLALDLLPG